jgi:dienelactone hydrolase
VALVHGSGPLDRDGAVGPNRPYRDLADGLGARGIAVLRYDKRTLVHRAAMAAFGPGLTVDDEVVDDALAAVRLLRGAPGVDPEAIFVLGHSLGGYLAPRIAARSPEVRGVIVLAGNARGLAEVILDQMETISAAEGAATPEAAAAIETIRRQVARLESPDLSPDTPPAELPFGVPAAYWLDLRDYDPAATAARLGRPILILAGGRDYQVTRADFEGWERSLGDDRDATLRWFPDLNHLLIAGDGPVGPADYAIAGHVAAVIPETIAARVDGIVAHG